MAGSYLAFEVDALRQKYAGAASPYNEFLRRRGMSVGLYVLPVGVEDRQTPHMADEVYVVLQGRGRLRVVDEETEVNRARSSRSTTARNTGSSTSPRTCTCSWCSRHRICQTRSNARRRPGRGSLWSAALSSEERDRARLDPQRGVESGDRTGHGRSYPCTVGAVGRDLAQAGPDRVTVRQREQVSVEPDGKGQQGKCGRLGRGGVAEYHRVTQVSDQLMVQPTVGLVRAVHRNDVQDPMIIALEDADVDQAVLHGAVRTPAEVTHPVVRAVRSARLRDGSQGTVQQRLAGRTVLGESHLLVGMADPLPERQVEQQRTTEPQVEVGDVDQRAAGGGIVGQEVQVLGERDHPDTVRRSRPAECSSRCVSRTSGTGFMS